MYRIAIALLFCITLASCRTTQMDEVEILEPEIFGYSMCEADEAQFSLSIEFEVKGVTSRKEVYHFPKVITSEEIFMASLLSCHADGSRGGYGLTYGLDDVNSTGVVFSVACYHSLDGKTGKMKRIIPLPYFHPFSENTDQFSMKATWKREPNQLQDPIFKGSNTSL